MRRSKDLSEQIECYICHAPASEMHHMLMGSMRQRADDHNFVIPLCYKCHHVVVHDTVGHWKKDLQKMAQEIYEQDHTREEFIKEFGKSFL